MNENQFAYWLNGFAELSGDAPPSPEQWKLIREHLSLVFNKVTPQIGGHIGSNHSASMADIQRRMQNNQTVSGGAIC